MLRSNWTAIPLLILLAGSISQAAAQGKQPSVRSLFGPAPGGARANQILGMRPQTIGAVSQFPLSIDPDDVVGNRTASPTQQRMLIALPGGKSVTCVLLAESRPDGLTVLSGAPIGEGAASRCDLVVDGGQVTGDVETASGRYRIQPVGSGTMHAVVEVRTESLPNEGESLQPGEEGDQRSNSSLIENAAQLCNVKLQPGERPKQFGPLRVMLLYTPAVRKNSKNIRADVELIMTQMRRALSTTGLGGEFSVSAELVYSGEVNYVEPPAPDGSMESDLWRLTGKMIKLPEIPQLRPYDEANPIFKRIRALRDTHRAHLVHMLIEKRPNDPCGIGWQGPRMSAVSPAYTYSVSDRQCALAQFSAIHEMAHNIGLNHDRYVVPMAKPGPDEFNYGFINVQKGVRSIMAYVDQCNAQKNPCRRILQFSSPNVRVGGAVFGRAANDAKAADNVEVLCRSAPIMARR